MANEAGLGVAVERLLPLEQLRVEVLEESEHQPLLGAEVVVDLAERNPGHRSHLAGGQGGIAALAQHRLGGVEERVAGSELRHFLVHGETLIRSIDRSQGIVIRH